MEFKKNGGNDVPGMTKHYGMVKRIIRYLICILSSVVASLIVVYILAELQVLWYMRQSHIVNRIDLGDDLGLGLLSLLLIPAFIICLPISFSIIWKLLKKI